MLMINQTNISNNYYNNIKTNKKVTTNTIISNNQLTKSATNFKGIWWTRPQNIADTQKINKSIPFRESALAEFDKGNTSKVSSNQYLKGHKRGMKNKIPTEKQLTQFWKYISTHTHFTFEDIKRFTGDK